MLLLQDCCYDTMVFVTLTVKSAIEAIWSRCYKGWLGLHGFAATFRSHEFERWHTSL